MNTSQSAKRFHDVWAAVTNAQCVPTLKDYNLLIQFVCFPKYPIVNFGYLLCQAWISETHLGSLLRAQRESVGQNSVLLTSIVHKRILEQDCINRGWVMTGFPNTAEDIKNLEMLDTPPNRYND